MSAGGWIEGGVLVAFGAGLAVNRARVWADLGPEERLVSAVRIALPALLGASALASAAGAASGVEAVLLGAFVLDVVAAVVLGVRRRARPRPPSADPPR